MKKGRAPALPFLFFGERGTDRPLSPGRSKTWDRPPSFTGALKNMGQTALFRRGVQKLEPFQPQCSVSAYFTYTRSAGTSSTLSRMSHTRPVSWR